MSAKLFIFLGYSIMALFTANAAAFSRAPSYRNFPGTQPTSACGIDKTGSSAKTIFGLDDRHEMVPTQYPYNTIGKLLLYGHDTSGNRKLGSICTGSLVGSNLVLTAAHCVVGRVPADIEFYLGAQYNGVAEQSSSADTFRPGKYLAKSIANAMILGTVQTSGNDRNDWAILELNDSLGDRFGWLGWRKAQATDINQPVNNAGYSFDFDAPYGSAGVHEGCMIRKIASHEAYIADELLLMDCDIRGGASGGPLFSSSTSCKSQILGVNHSEYIFPVGTRFHELIANTAANAGNAGPYIEWLKKNNLKRGEVINANPKTVAINPERETSPPFSEFPERKPIPVDLYSVKFRSPTGTWIHTISKNNRPAFVRKVIADLNLAFENRIKFYAPDSTMFEMSGVEKIRIAKKSELMPALKKYSSQVRWRHGRLALVFLTDIEADAGGIAPLTPHHLGRFSGDLGATAAISLKHYQSHGRQVLAHQVGHIMGLKHSVISKSDILDADDVNDSGIHESRVPSTKCEFTQRMFSAVEGSSFEKSDPVRFADSFMHYRLHSNSDQAGFFNGLMWLFTDARFECWYMESEVSLIQ